ncbi:MAG: S46 family peptidase, partial [Phycisphaerales bacterium]|nr:S46 family peptidase [Phycisphaerales bacterium]
MRRVLSLALAAAALVVPAFADEGMWLINRPPSEHLKKAYGFEPTPEWLEHVQKSAVRFSTGGSGSIVSAGGLVMTNHHVASDMLAKLSTPQRDLLEVGFHAVEPTEELKCPDLELLVLWSIGDVTERVKGAAEGLSGAEANTARRRMMSQIEQEAKEASGLHSEVVTLYQGGVYHLYQYRRYTDVRLVFAPEQQAAFFGGDTDNFEFPRWCLDMTFFRIYEDGEPLRPEHHLRWSANGSNEGDLAFVVGHPGSTRRAYTSDHLAFLRDVEQVQTLNRLWRSEVKLQGFCSASAENNRIGKDMLHGVANGRKARTGRLAGLLDPALMARKAEDERVLRAAVDAKPEWKKNWGDAWDQVAAAQKIHEEFYTRRAAIGGSSDLLGKAMTVLRLADELPKPSAERLRR